MRKSTVSVRETVPSPWQVGQVVGDAPCAVAARAGDVELHAPAHLRHLAGAVALRALHAAAGGRLAVAGGAGLLAVDLDARLAAADGGPEVDRGLVFEVGARLRAVRLLGMLRAREDAGEDVFEAAPAGAAGFRAAVLAGNAALEAGEVEAAEVDRPAPAAGALLPRVGLGRRRVDLVGVEAHLVVNLALLLVAQNVVGLGDLLELLFGALVAGFTSGWYLRACLRKALRISSAVAVFLTPSVA